MNTDDYMKQMRNILKDKTYKTTNRTYLEQTTKTKVKAANLDPEVGQDDVVGRRSVIC